MAIVATVIVLALPALRSYRSSLAQVHCRQNLADIGVALQKYSEANGGQDPGSLRNLVPQYLHEDQVVCPVLVERVPEIVAQMRAGAKKAGWATWASYGKVNVLALDALARHGNLPISFSALLRRRGNQTPRVICFDHREPYSLPQAMGSGPKPEVRWYEPEQPLLLLRWSGRVEASRWGVPRGSGIRIDELAYFWNA